MIRAIRVICGEKVGRLAAKKRKRRRSRKVSQSSQSADTEEAGDEPKKSPSGYPPRIDLGLPPVPRIGEGFFTGDEPSKDRDNPSLGSISVCLLCRRSEKAFSQETTRVKTETILPSDRPRYASCAADRISLFHRRRTVPNRRVAHGTHGTHGQIFTAGNRVNGGDAGRVS